MLSLFKDDKPFILLFIPLFAIALWIGQLLEPTFTMHVYNAYPMPLYRLILWIVPNASVISIAISISVLLLNAYQVARINARYKLIEKGTFLPGIVYILFASSTAFIRELNPIFFANTFLLFAIHRLFATYKADRNLAPYFESALLVSIASLFYFPHLFLMIGIWGLIGSLRSFRWREWAVSIFGMATPYYLYSVYGFFTGEMKLFAESISANITTNSHQFNHPIYFWIFAGACAFFLIVAIGFSFSGVIKKVNARKYYNSFILISILTATAFLAIPGTNIELLGILAIPFSFFFTNHLLRMSSLVLAELVFLVFISLLVTLQFLG